MSRPAPNRKRRPAASDPAIGRRGDPRRNWLASRRVHGSPWKAGLLDQAETGSPGCIAGTGHHPKRPIVESDRGRHGRGEPLAPPCDRKGSAAGSLRGGTGQNEIIPWWNYFLGMLRSAYQEFERQVESVEARPAKRDLVRQTVLVQVKPFTLADMAAQLPAVSSQLIKKVLAEMKKAGQVRLVGRGRGARWEVTPP